MGAHSSSEGEAEGEAEAEAASISLVLRGPHGAKRFIPFGPERTKTSALSTVQLSSAWMGGGGWAKSACGSGRGFMVLSVVGGLDQELSTMWVPKRYPCMVP
mgnify:FL=1